MEKILHLTLKKKWFDMILSGEKKEEYREIKPYWDKRFIGKNYGIVRFKNGYGKNSPVMDIECRSIGIGYGTISHGAPKGLEVYIIRLGEIIRSENI